MTQSIIIHTTTLPNGEFDIFHFQETLEQEDTLSLYEIQAECHAMELLHLRCAWRNEDKPEEHKAKTRLFGELSKAIAREIHYRKHPSLRPPHEN